RRETASYPEPLRRKIAWERRVTIAFHVAVMAALYLLGGLGVLARAYLVPVFLVFPIAFALNRLGQHYRITPPAPAPPRIAALLRGDGLEADDVRAAVPSVDLREQDAAHRLAPRGLGSVS